MRTLAYLDAGTGSMIVQAVVAGTAGAAVVAKVGWRRMTGTARKRLAGPTQDSPATTATTATAVSDVEDRVDAT